MRLKKHITEGFLNIKAIVVKPDLPDGFQIKGPLFSYMDSIENAWRKYPILHTARFPLILSAKDNTRFINVLNFFFRSIKDSFSNRQEKEINMPACDVLIFSSSNKPSFQPALDNLGEALAKRGIKVTRLFPDKLEMVEKQDSRITIKKFPEVLQNFQSYSINQVIKMLGSSLLNMLVLLYLAFAKNNRFMKELIRNPFNVWYQLFVSFQKLEFANLLLRNLRPRILITNGDHIPIASELVISPEAQNSYKIIFFNEHPTEAMVPFVSDEVWVWNTTVKSSLIKLLGKYAKPKITIIGNAQIDLVRQGSDTISKEELRLQRLTKKGKVVIFLSEYDENPMLNTGGITQEALKWLSQAAQELTDWYFIIRARPYHFDKILPGIGYISKLPNVILPKQEISFRNFLRWDNCFAVVACGSTGLFVARGVGKYVLRLIVSQRSVELKVIDEIALSVHSYSELVKTLKKIEKGEKPNNKSKKIEIENIYPYMGKVIDVMEKRVINLLYN